MLMAFAFLLFLLLKNKNNFFPPKNKISVPLTNAPQIKLTNATFHCK